MKHESWLIASINIPMIFLNGYQAFHDNGKYEPYFSLFFVGFGLCAFVVTGLIPTIFRRKK